MEKLLLIKMSNKENITKILLLGETGVGKSSLGNYIIGKEKLLSSGKGTRVTTQIGGEISERELYEDIFIIDTPGFQDTQLEDSQHLEELKNNFKDRNAGVRAICILLNFSEPRFTDYLQKQILIYCHLFLIEDFWDHVSIVFTKAYYYTPKDDFDLIKQDLESPDGLINSIINKIKDETEKINESKKNDRDFKKIKAPCKLPVFFIDSTLKNVNNLRTKEEMNKLIEWARKKDYLDLQNIKKNKIDPNYLSTEKIKDIIEPEDIQYSNNFEIYSKKFFAQYKKTNFHGKIAFFKDPKPYKIEQFNYKLIKADFKGDKEIESYEYFKITKFFIDGEEQKDKETKVKIYTETRTKEIWIDPIENKPKERILKEFDDGRPKSWDTKEIEGENYVTEEQTEEITADEYRDYKTNYLDFIEHSEKGRRHLRELENTVNNITLGYGIASIFNPFNLIGTAFCKYGYNKARKIYAEKEIIVKQKRKITKFKKYILVYKKFSNGTRKYLTRIPNGEETKEGSWEYC